MESIMIDVVLVYDFSKGHSTKEVVSNTKAFGNCLKAIEYITQQVKAFDTNVDDYVMETKWVA
jgi:hypothetical protein